MGAWEKGIIVKLECDAKEFNEIGQI